MTEQLALQPQSEGLALPPIQEDLLRDETPAQAQEFLYGSTDSRCPIDDQTAMPLPIAPRNDMAGMSDEYINVHHHYYPRTSPLLRNSLGGKALRASRLQRVVQTQHNYGATQYHAFFTEGPPVPTDPDEQLGPLVLACAGYIPDRVVDTSRGEPVIRQIKNWELERLRRPSSCVPPKPLQVKRYRDKHYPDLALADAKAVLLTHRHNQAQMTYQNLRYGFDPIKNFVVDRVFNNIPDLQATKLENRFIDKQNIEAGLCLLALGASLSVEKARVRGEPLNIAFRQFQSEGRLNPLMLGSAATLVKNKLGSLPVRRELLPGLRSFLLQQRDDSASSCRLTA